MSILPPELEKFMPSKEELAKADEDMSVIFRVVGTQTNGKPFWAYLAVPPSKILPFKEAEAAGNYKLEDYGKIMAAGEESEPPAEVVQMMKEEHGCDPEFEKKVVAEVEKTMKEQQTGGEQVSEDQLNSTLQDRIKKIRQNKEDD